MKSFLPPPDVLVKLEPEEAGLYLLPYLNDLEAQGTRLNFYNLLNGGSNHVNEYVGESNFGNEVRQVLAEAIQWLTNENYIASSPENSNGWIFVTRRGKRIKKREDHQQYSHLSFLPYKYLDEVLKDKVVSSFIRGEFETCVFIALKEVEIRIREKAYLSKDDFGTRLVDKAFNPDSGILVDEEQTDSEKKRIHELIKGFLGTFKNPVSHRDVDHDDPVNTAGIILFANLVLQLIEKRGERATLEKMKSEQALHP